jgi:hypothetical protein
MANTQTSLEGGAKPLDFGTINYVHSPFGGKLPIEVKPTNEVVNTPIKVENLQSSKAINLEDKFYELIGIKYKPKNDFGLNSTTSGRLLVAVVLVAGYFAYKKFKK